ncbi:hypothetical protein J2X97_001858 [Epilithonimonas hungarica]|uniref:hypothetical protein n=1 Tax=Epilithonimonas hungarica TaxID=454006 RepID=UPI00278634FB|nr:hypothetical protein [Epilithonimonas hungarica]MDP9956221.1 hypothetical protein [Epilithonimonas hungarica]
MKKHILFFLAFISGILSAQSITLLGKTSASAKGSGSNGIPSLTWDIPAGNNRVMIVHFWFERDHRPSPGANHPSANFGASYFPLTVGTVSMTGRTALRTYSREDNTTPTETNAEFSTEFYRYTLSDAEGLPTGTAVFDFSGIQLPKNAGDEIGISIEVYGNVSPTTSYTAILSNSITGTSTTVSNYSQTIPAATLPQAGRTLSDNWNVVFGGTNKNQTLSLNAGWTPINDLQVTNTDGNGFNTVNGARPLNEADGLNMVTGYSTGAVNLAFTMTRAGNDTQRIQVMRINSVRLLPLAKPSINGNVYNDTDGSADINGTTVNGGGLYVNLIDANGLLVYSAAVISGAFTIPAGYVTEGENYTLLLSKNTGTVGQPAPVKELNAGWVTVGESTVATGNDGSPNGQLSITAGTVNITGLRYGISKESAPGGVTSGLGLWVKADEAFSQSLWKDQSGNDYDLTQPTVAMQPVTANPWNQFNFNPAVNFNNKAMGNNQIANRGVNNSLSMYSVASLEESISANTLIGVGSNGDNPHLGAYPGLKFMMWTSLYNTAANPDIKLSQSYLMSGHWEHAVAGTARIEFDGFVARSGGNQNSPAGNFVVGNDFINSVNQPWKGLIPEVIVYTSPKSGNENQRINSYLGIKYGLTLRSGGIDTGTFNYLSSTSETVWNGSDNSIYHNNVFGIARDDISTLYQKQSKSVNSGQKLIVGKGNTLSDTNAANSNTLTNGQFLMIGDNGLKQSLSISLNNPSALGGEVNYRFESLWKVQNTGNIGTVIIAWPKSITNLQLVHSTDATIDESDDFVPMSNEVTINGIVYNTATVTFKNGDYFTFAGYAHAPGGVVNNLNYWYRADKNAVNSGPGTDVTSWTDFFSETVSSKMGTNAFPKYVKGAANYFNYNPGIQFTAALQSLGNDKIASTVTSTDYDIFTFTKEGWTPVNGANNRIFSALSNINYQTGSIHYWDGIGINKRFASNTADEVESVSVNITDRYLAVPGNINFSATIPSIMYHRYGNTSVSRGLNGEANGANGVFSPRGVITGGHIFGSTIFNGNGSDNDNALGHIGETIIYGAGNLTETERRRVDSYLAIKYGLTLARVTTSHYLSSAETVVWNGAQNILYNNNIFGLGRDDISALHQKVSVSVNSGTILTLATNNDFVTDNLDPSRTIISDNQEFFLAGDNNDTDLPMVVTTFGGNSGKVIQRKWLSQRTGTLGNVYFQADLSAYESQFNIPNTTVYMIIGDDDAFTTNRVLVTGTKVGSKWVFNHNFDSENTKRYFTFGILLSNSALCYKTGATTGGATLDGKVGISALSRAGADNPDQWPMLRKGAWLVLEAKTKGFVPNRTAFDASNNPVGIAPANFVEGMMVYDITNKCLKIYTNNGTAWGWYCMTTQACPD